MAGRLPRVTGAVGSIDTAGEGGILVPFIYLADQNTSASTVASANDVRGGQWVLPLRITVRKVVISIKTLSAVGSGNDVCGVGIFDKDKSLLFETGALSTTSTGAISTTLATAVTLEPGVYWGMYTIANTTAALQGIRTASTGISMEAFLNENSDRIGVAANSASPVGVMPAALGAITSGATFMPVIYLES